MAKVLLTGGAGYVGGSVATHLRDRGHDVWIVDDLSTGHRSFVRGYPFTLARVGDDRCAELLKRERFDAVLHFAAWSLVGESVQHPDRYFENNTEQTEKLLAAMRVANCTRLVFSSTCAIFGDTGDQDISEDLPKKPLNPYGESKLRVETAIQRASEEWGLAAIPLRYFNAGGAETKLRVGEWHTPETHLIPNVIQAALENRPVQIFGSDYSTPDGTCVRDYIHVDDLAHAHSLALDSLLKKPTGTGFFRPYNLGSAHGYSVREVIHECQSRLMARFGLSLEAQQFPRRPGDAPRLVADSRRANSELGFKAERTLREIVDSACDWEMLRRHPRRAVFLDRDGTINLDPGYISKPEDLTLLPGAGEGLARFSEAGYDLVVVSNQSGVNRGLIPPDALPKIHAHLGSLLAPFGVKIEAYELCLHTPDEKCDCRKPHPKLLLNAARRMKIDLSRSIMIGDRITDLEAGKNAGVGRVILVRTGDGKKTEASLPEGLADAVTDDLNQASLL